MAWSHTPRPERPRPPHKGRRAPGGSRAPTAVERTKLMAAQGSSRKAAGSNRRSVALDPAKRGARANRGGIDGGRREARVGRAAGCRDLGRLAGRVELDAIAS